MIYIHICIYVCVCVYVYMCIGMYVCISSLVAQTILNLLAMWEIQVQSLDWKDPWKREWLPTPIFLTGGLQAMGS